ncbi:MAG TPA: hypothetical protein VGB17_08795 [Pyrinomonadaceae bacterium]
MQDSLFYLEAKRPGRLYAVVSFQIISTPGGDRGPRMPPPPPKVPPMPYPQG